MSSRGVTTMADIARALDTTPQAVSNWKARNQVPYRVIAKLNHETKTKSFNQGQGPPIAGYQLQAFEEDTISLSDILLTMAEQLKVILLVPFITVFLTFTYIQFIRPPLFISSATILLPDNKPSLSGLGGLASQFGVNMPEAMEADLSSPSLFPELVKSRTFSERMMEKSFYTEIFRRELPLLSILTYGESPPPNVKKNALLLKAMGAFQSMVTFKNEGSFSIISVKANEPGFARDLNKEVLDELKSLNHFFKSKHVNEKISFIEDRINAVEEDLQRSEQNLKLFREQNRQILSPALQLEHERLGREVEIQKGIYLTLKQQLELAKIEEIQEASIVQVLDEPQAPLGPSNKDLKLSILLAGVLGVVFGIFIGFIRTYTNNADVEERKKLRRVKHLFIKKGKDLLKDARVSGVVGLLLLFGLPFFLGHKSQNPVFFGMYSAKLLVVNTVYILTLLFFLCFFVYLIRKKK